MAEDPEKPGADDTASLVRAELRRRGLADEEIESLLRKKRRRKVLEFDLVKARHLVDEPGNSPAYRRPSPRPVDALCTVDEAADRLKLHPKTVLRMIRAGRLKATRIGKAYRIRQADLEAFAGAPPAAEAPAEAAWATSIVDVPGVGPDLARQWARTLPAALQAGSGNGPPMRAEIVYEPERAHLKIVLVGPPAETAGLLGLIGVWLKELRGA